MLWLFFIVCIISGSLGYFCAGFTTRKAKQFRAYRSSIHEAGHIVCALSCKSVQSITSSHINREEGGGSVVVEYIKHADPFEALTISLGGLAAEHLKIKKINSPERFNIDFALAKKYIDSLAEINCTCSANSHKNRNYILSILPSNHNFSERKIGILLDALKAAEDILIARNKQLLYISKRLRNGENVRIALLSSPAMRPCDAQINNAPSQIAHLSNHLTPLNTHPNKEISP